MRVIQYCAKRGATGGIKGAGGGWGVGWRNVEIEKQIRMEVDRKER